MAVSESCAYAACSDMRHRGFPFLGVVAKRCYRIVAGRLDQAEAHQAINLEAVQSPTGDGDLQLVHDSDKLCFEKPLTDVLVRGSAHSRHGAVTQLDTGIRVGRVDKRVRVIGNRQLRLKADGTLSESAPEPFERMPLSWQRAYGGRDIGAEKLIVPDRDARLARRGIPTAEDLDGLGAFCYLRNRVGRGFVIDVERSRLDGMPLPTQVDPDDPVTVERLLAREPNDWLDRPIAAGYEPIDWLTYPRVLLFGLHPAHAPAQRPIRELALGGLLREDLEREPGSKDPRAYQCAPPGMAVCLLKGNERVSLWNLHRDHELLEFDLPGAKPKLLVEPPNTRTFELEAELKTVLIEPDEDRVTLTWAGAMDVAAPYPEPMCQEMRHAAIWS